MSRERPHSRVLVLAGDLEVASALGDSLAGVLSSVRGYAGVLGVDPISRVREVGADVVVVDARGGGMDWVATSRAAVGRLKSFQGISHIPILMLLDAGTEESLEAPGQEDVGPDVWLTSPISERQLAGQVGALCRLGIAESIAQNRLLENSLREQEWTVRLLALLADFQDAPTLIGKLAGYLKEWTGCDAVAIRFRDGFDFPYAGTRGFSADFVEKECRLCVLDRAGEPLRDEGGEVVLECLCGHVLRGRTDPSFPWFTPRGSFWTNDLRALLSGVGPEQLPPRLRGRCAMEGYRSLALIPLNHGGETLGLLQLNDHRAGRFTAQSVAFLEGSADQITLALRQRRLGVALKLSEQRFREAVENSQAGYCRVDATGLVTAVNEAWLRMHRCHVAEESVGRPFLDHIADPDRMAARELMGQLLGGKSVPRSDLTRVCRDGSLAFHTMSAHPVRERDGVVGFEGFLIDSTAQRQAEDRMRRQAELLDAANDAIYAVDLQGRVTYCNAAAGRFHPLPESGDPPPLLSDLMEVEPTTFDSAMATVLSDDLWTGDLKLPQYSGREAVLLCRWSLLRSPSGAPEAILAIHSDITEHKRLESQFLRAQRLEGIGALASGIAHDMNNILAPVLMIAPILREGTSNDTERRTLVNTIEGCARRGAEIIGQLLTFARGKPEARVPLPVPRLLAEIDKLVRATFPREIEARLEVEADLSPVLGDATQIHQALMNLCLNARDAMPEGGVLTLAASNVEVDDAGDGPIPGSRSGAFVCLRVADTGAGIDPADLDRIFDPFFTTKDPGKGTGLGLSTVLGIVRGHDGFVRVNSRPGAGTSFELFFPAESGLNQAQSAEEDPQPLARGHGEVVLVVEDEEALTDTIRHALERQGYRVLTAARGDQAVATFTRYSSEVDLVLTDMMMPGMSGAAALRALRQIRPDFVAVGMTGLPDRAAIRGLEDLGLNALLTKPFAPGELLRVIENALHPSPVTPAP